MPWLTVFIQLLTYLFCKVVITNHHNYEHLTIGNPFVHRLSANIYSYGLATKT